MRRSFQAIGALEGACFERWQHCVLEQPTARWSRCAIGVATMAERHGYDASWMTLVTLKLFVKRFWWKDQSASRTPKFLRRLCIHVLSLWSERRSVRLVNTICSRQKHQRCGRACNVTFPETRGCPNASAFCDFAGWSFRLVLQWRLYGHCLESDEKTWSVQWTAGNEGNLCSIPPIFHILCLFL